MRACFSRRGAPEALLYAFDLLELDGRNLRNEPWARRRATLVQLLAGAGPGIRLCEHIEDADGAVVLSGKAPATRQTRVLSALRKGRKRTNIQPAWYYPDRTTLRDFAVRMAYPESTLASG